MEILNIAAYKFVEIVDVPALRAPLKARCDALGLKGTILVAPEGINLFLAGLPASVGEFLCYLREDALFGGLFSDLPVKESLSKEQPFRRMLVRQKKEIITMRHPTIKPVHERAHAVKPETLKNWLDQGHDDEGREVVLLDTRNAFEVEVGTFEGAEHFSIRQFGEFPEAIRRRAADPERHYRDKTIVTFCTGGIRCEKAALYMRELDLPHVVQLDGGILRYFEEVGGAHWKGECFVFDDRVALDPSLRETATTQCYACRAVVTPAEQFDPRYVRGKSCPQCWSAAPSENSGEEEAIAPAASAT